jgi:putative ABC transport system permease protein
VFARLLWSSLRARRARLLLGTLAVTLGVAVATALATLALRVGDDLVLALRAAGPNFVVLPLGARLPLDLGGAELEPARAGMHLDPSAVTSLKSGFWKNNVLEAAPEITVDAAVEGAPITLVGTWFEHELAVSGGGWPTGLARLRPNWELTGRWPAEPGTNAASGAAGASSSAESTATDRDGAGEIALGRGLARRIGAGVGDWVRVSVNDRSTRWRVSAVVDPGGRDEDRAWAPLALVQDLAGRTNEIDRVWASVLVKPPTEEVAPDPARDPIGYERFMCTPFPANVAKDLAQALPGAEVLPMTEVVAGEGMVVARLDLLMLLLALAALTASVLGLFSTSTAAVVERSAELGLLRSIGATSGEIAALLLGETVLISLAGGVMGWALGAASATAIRGETFGVAGGVPTLLLPLAIVISLVVALLGTLGPLRMALRLDPARVVRE